MLARVARPRGRHHDAVRRMARALAAAGHVVVAPEVPRWTALQLTAHDTEPVVCATLDALGVAAGLERVRTVAGVGGFADLERTVRAMVVGEHEWAGRDYRFRPDPYGRWIVGAAWLPALADALVAAALADDPALQPHDRLRRLAIPTILLHGRADVIVPFPKRCGSRPSCPRPRARTSRSRA